jgi:hypothetical protein
MCSLNVVNVTELRSVRLSGHITRTRETKYKILHMKLNKILGRTK